MASPLLKKVLAVALLVVSAAVLFGALANHKGHKYSYSGRRDDHCRRYVLTLDQDDSHMCCDEYHHGSDWLCIAVFSKVSRILASGWAWILPILPAMLTTLIDLFLIVIIPSSPKQQPETLSLTQKILAHAPSMHLQRFLVYVLVIFIRTFGLYLIPETLVDLLYSRGVLSSTASCWCPEFVSAKKCEMRFDFSDHIVLIVFQYVLPFSLEFAFLSFNRLGSGEQSGDSRIGAWWALYYLPMCAIVVFFVVCVRAMLFTALFFHTPAESLVGLGIGIAASWLFVSFVNVSRRRVMPTFSAGEPTL